MLFFTRQEASNRYRFYNFNEKSVYFLTEGIFMYFWQNIIETNPNQIRTFNFCQNWQKLGGGNIILYMPQVRFIHTYDDIISIDNLLLAWKEFIIGKKSRKDVQEFERNLMANVISLHQDLKNKTYKHSLYKAFRISDPKPLDIHKAQVRDRLLHHAIYRTLYPYFDKKFIHDSYSCRINKGTHKAIERFRTFSRKVSKNNTRTCFVLKCDIRKFFANIDHQTLKSILSKCQLYSNR